jgi:hypothetical protein
MHTEETPLTNRIEGPVDRVLCTSHITEKFQPGQFDRRLIITSASLPSASPLFEHLPVLRLATLHSARSRYTTLGSTTLSSHLYVERSREFSIVSLPPNALDRCGPYSTTLHSTSSVPVRAGYLDIALVISRLVSGILHRAITAWKGD